MIRWLRRLFLLAVISGAAFAAWTALQRRNELTGAPTAPSPTPSPPPPPRSQPTPPPPTVPATPPATPAAELASSARWRQPIAGACPDGYPIKVAKSGIYHVPGGRSYDRTTAERCYVNTDDAEADGYRRAKA
jgi:hypothetical protein